MQLPEDIKFIAVEGVIGVGKTTFSEFLAERLQGRCMLEEFEENPFLERFYQDRDAYAFQTQLFFLLSRHKQFQSFFTQHDLFFDRVVSDYSLDKDRIFATQNLNEDELAMYDKVSAVLERDSTWPDYIIYLRAGVSTLQKRIKKRNRAMERNMDPDYLADLIERYDHHFFHYKACPVLIINTDNIDFVENPRDLENLINTIENVPSGVYVYTPESLQ